MSAARPHPRRGRHDREDQRDGVPRRPGWDLHAPPGSPPFSAIAVSLAIESVALLLWGAEVQTFRLPVVTSWELGPFFTTPVQVAILVTGLIAMVARQLLLTRTALGKAIRATADNLSVAVVVGTADDLRREPPLRASPPARRAAPLRALPAAERPPGGGPQKLLELARALMTDPRLLLLDEPAAGINPALLDRLVDLIRALHAKGKGSLIVEHDMRLVMTLCQKVVVLDYGETIASGTPEEVVCDPRVLDADLGTPGAA